MGRRPDDQAWREVFRRLSWVYVWGPPVMLVVIALGGGALVALVLPLGWPFWQRWLLTVVLAVGLPAIAFWARKRMWRGDDEGAG